RNKSFVYFAIQLDNSPHSDILRKERIECMYTFVRIIFQLAAGAIEVNKELLGMHTGVRSPSANSLDRLSQYCPQSCIEHLLHRDGVGLKLPTVIRRPVVTYFHIIAIRIFHSAKVIISA